MAPQIIQQTETKQKRIIFNNKQIVWYLSYAKDIRYRIVSFPFKKIKTPFLPPPQKHGYFVIRIFPKNKKSNIEVIARSTLPSSNIARVSIVRVVHLRLVVVGLLWARSTTHISSFVALIVVFRAASIETAPSARVIIKAHIPL
jgi:hypothetical protein